MNWRKQKYQHERFSQNILIYYYNISVILIFELLEHFIFNLMNHYKYWEKFLALKTPTKALNNKMPGNYLFFSFQEYYILY